MAGDHEARPPDNPGETEARAGSRQRGGSEEAQRPSKNPDEEEIRERRGLSELVSVPGLIAFELYLILLGALTGYALWRIWPYAGADPSVHLFGFQIDFEGQTDSRLMMVAGLAGLLGAFIHTATSFATYLGNLQFRRSWIPWYLLRPLIGMALGILVHLVFMAGFISGNQPDAVSPYGVGAICGLAGLFSKQTVDKLREVFENAFPTKDDQRKHKLEEDGAAGPVEAGDQDEDSEENDATPDESTEEEAAGREPEESAGSEASPPPDPGR